MKFPLDIPHYQFDIISFQRFGNLFFLELSILFFQQITKLFSSVGQLTIFLSGTENYFPQWVRKLFYSVGQKTIFLSGSVNDILDELNGEDEMRDSRCLQDQVKVT